MPITRTAWIDDDGSGEVGTIINNAEKTLLYDQIDGLVGGVLQGVAFNPANFTANNGATWTMPAGGLNMTYTYLAKNLMLISAYWTGATVSGGPPTNLNIKIPAGRSASAVALGAAYISTPGFEVCVGLVGGAGNDNVQLHRNGIAPFPVGASSGYVEILVPVL